MSPHIGSVDLARGYASLLVCLFHLTAAGKLLGTSVLASFCSVGGIDGVLIFFVISGFVIPLSMHANGYTIDQFWTFMLKRIVRIDPPYIVSIVVALLLWWRFRFSVTGHPLRTDDATPFLHLAYLVDLASLSGQKYHWYVSVYWTLAYEFQYYITIALIFGFVSSTNSIRRWSAIVLLMAAPIVISSGFVPNLPVYLSQASFFVFGILLYQRRMEVIGNRELVLIGLPVVAFMAWAQWRFCIYAPLLALLFLRCDIDTPITSFMGRISYSLYLYHDSFGSWFRGALVVVLGFPPAAAAFAAVLASIGVAYGFYLAVDKWSIALSKRIRYARPATCACAPPH
jgi:peptidoglycan/LPS O-acetylase OafA/YrhL